MSFEIKPNLGGHPERMKLEGIKVHGNVLVKVGEKIQRVSDGQVFEIEDIFIDPNGNERGFEKLLKLTGVENPQNPKKYKKYNK